MRYTLSLLILMLLSLPAAAKMYKWVDENGKTHFGDTIPPQYAKQGNVELNKAGVVVKQTDAALTPEQRKAKEEEEARKKEEARKIEEQKRRDSALLNTYTTDKEIDLVRDRNLQQGTLQIQGMELRIKQIQPRLNASHKKAETFKASGKSVPVYLQQEVQETEKEMQHLQETVKQRRQEMEAVRARFEDDKKRFRELRQTGDSTNK